MRERVARLPGEPGPDRHTHVRPGLALDVPVFACQREAVLDLALRLVDPPKRGEHPVADELMCPGVDAEAGDLASPLRMVAAALDALLEILEGFEQAAADRQPVPVARRHGQLVR